MVWQSRFWTFEILFLLIMAGYVAAILAMTAQRSWVSPATLAIGTAAGTVIGVVLYALLPLGMSRHATSPWLSGTAVKVVEWLAWTVLFAAPLAAGLAAALRYRVSTGGMPVNDAKARQGIVAGLCAGLTGALFVTVLGTGTIALMPNAGWVLHGLYPGRHLIAAVARHLELTASANAAGYFLILFAFPIIGAGLGAWGGLAIAGQPAGRPQDNGGAPGPEPTPDPSFGATAADR